jgi:inhibitor of KinA
MQIQPIGENAVILLMPYDNTSTSVGVIRQIYQKLQESDISGITSIRPGLDCLLIEFQDPAVPERINKALKDFQPSTTQEDPAKTEIVRIPVCYEPEYGTDLSSVASQTGLTSESIVNLHSSQVYKVWMIGFMPGFPYLGELPAGLHLPRKATPDAKLAAGSVAIAEEFVGVYPFDSPGGWHVLGRTPLRLTNYSRSNPFLFRYGMSVQFYPITKDEFEKLKETE